MTELQESQDKDSHSKMTWNFKYGTVRVLLTVFLLSIVVIIILLINGDVFSNSNEATNFNKYDNVDSAVYTTEEELSRFENLILKQWPSGKPKAVIYLLINSRTVESRLLFGLKLLDIQFNIKHDYPVILFHEDDLTHQQKIAIRKESRSNIFFQEVKFKIPEWVTESPDVFLNRCTFGAPGHIGYRHMCRFHTRLVFEHPIMKNVAWYLRIDDDSKILEKIDYDLFKYMDSNHYKYGYLMTTLDDRRCIVGLRSNVTKYFEQNKIMPTHLYQWAEDRIIYNNFEIASLDFWRSDEVWKFIEFIDNTGHIYHQRWGDAPIHTTAVMSYLRQSQVHEFTDISYEHQELISGSSKTALYYKYYGYISIFLKLFVMSVIASIVLFIGMVYFHRKKQNRKCGSCNCGSRKC